jgi:branched-chain amino acid transport system ATP-binding protein
VTLLDVDGIDGYYDESHIVRNVSMDVTEGEVVALLGRNGAGKTSTLRCIAGATPPDVRNGTVRFDDTAITNDPPEDIAVRGISLVPEERRVFADLTVAENLRLAETVRNRSNTWNRGLSFGDDGMSTGEIYEYFPRLDERRTQKAGTLSGGEQPDAR